MRISVSEKEFRIKSDGNDGVLLGMRCNNCGEYLFGSPSFCLNCTSDDLEQVELSKQGMLHTYTTIYTPPPYWKGPVPYVIGGIKLTEGPVILAEIVDCPQSELRVGLPLEMITTIWGQNAEGNEIVVYKWKPAGK